MTAIIIAKQRDCVHVVTDAATYTQQQEIICFGNKVVTLPHFPLGITTAGSAGAGPWMAIELAKEFSGFDDLIERAPERLPKIVQSCGIEIGTDVMLAGISKKRGPCSFVFRLNDALPLTGTREELDENPLYPHAAGALVELPDLVMTPIPSDQVMPANYEGVDLEGDHDNVAWSLKKIVTMQRHMRLPYGIGGIGGHAQLTTISADEITQRILCRWPEDKVGATLRPDPIDWQEWHRDNPKPGSGRKLRVVQ